jgi:hypothetical protein
MVQRMRSRIRAREAASRVIMYVVSPNTISNKGIFPVNITDLYQPLALGLALAPLVMEISLCRQPWASPVSGEQLLKSAMG